MIMFCFGGKSGEDVILDGHSIRFTEEEKHHFIIWILLSIVM